MGAKKLIKPERLRPGDTVALILPSSRIEDKKFTRSVKMIQSLGYCVVTYPGMRKSDLFFSSSDKDRAAEINWAFSEPGVRAVLSCRGGYGSVRILPHLMNGRGGSYGKRWLPKIFLGYSDVTYLHQWLQNDLGWTTVHGPLVGLLERAQLGRLFKDLTEMPTKPVSSKWGEIKNIGSPKKARGRLVGGTLSMVQLTGKAALPRAPVILALEDVNEDFYRLDRMIWSLIDAEYGSHVKGILLGNLLNCGRNDKKTFTLKRLHESLRKLTEGPIWTGCRFGHGVKNQRLLPLGCEVELSGKIFKTLEAVVS